MNLKQRRDKIIAIVWNKELHNYEIQEIVYDHLKTVFEEGKQKGKQEISQQ